MSAYQSHKSYKQQTASSTMSRRPLGVRVEPIVERFNHDAGYKHKLRSTVSAQRLNHAPKMPVHPDRNPQYRISPHAELEDPKETELVELSIQLEREHASAAAAMRTKNAEITALKTTHAVVLRELKEQQAQTQQEDAAAMKLLQGQLDAQVDICTAIIARQQESVERAHGSRNYTEDLMKEYEDETKDAKKAEKTAGKAARVAEEAARVAKSELKAARKERDYYIARYGLHTDVQPGTVLATGADTGGDRGTKRRREDDDIDEQRHIRSNLREGFEANSS